MLKFNNEQKKNIWLCSDWHFGHDREFIYKPRGFNSINEMNEAIIERHNSKVAPTDIVFCLGDCMLGENEKGIEYIKKLNGNIYIILGNHDTDKRIELYKQIPNVKILGYSTLIKVGKHPYYLSHYPTLTGNFDVPYPLNLYGHTHQQTSFYNEKPFMYHVGMDSHNCYPINFEDILIEIKEKIKECESFL